MKKYALIIGVEEYRDTMISRLQYARDDAAALAERLRGRCAFDQVRVLAESAGDDEPLLVNIVSALRDISGDLRPDDLFLFFFAGHGVEKDGHGYLLARDSLQAYPEHGSLSLELLRKSFEKLCASKRVLLLDACRNDPDAGRGDSANRMGDVISRDIVAAARSRQGGGTTTALLSACRSGQRAYEWPTKGHGVFTQYLLEGLDGAAWESEELEFERLAAYAADRVRQWSANTPGLPFPQEPWYEKFGDPGSIILATGRGSAAPPPPPPETVWHASVDGRASAGMGLTALKREIAAGRVERGTLVWSAELGVWTPAGAVPALAGTFPIIEFAPPHPPPPPKPREAEVMEIDCGGSVKLKLKRIPAGSFTMGGKVNADEQPVHRVTFAKPFYLGVYPVTQAQYGAVTGANPNHFTRKTDSSRCPVEQVSWEAATLFCQKLNEKLEAENWQLGEVRLPSEAEWEYACRAGSRTEYYFGDDESELEQYANYYGTPIYGGSSTSPVGTFLPNGWGLYDMHGNVWEWCEDKWHADYTGTPTDGSPWLSGEDSLRVNRGGSWLESAGRCRAAYRNGYDPGDRHIYLGFRVALSPAVH